MIFELVRVVYRFASAGRPQSQEKMALQQSS